LLKKTKSVCNNRQMYALQELFSWRDIKGRQEDESTNYVLPNHMLLKISTELPREMQGILACCNPIPPLVKQNLQELHMIILKARSKTLQSVDTDLLNVGQTDTEADSAQMDYNDNPLKCPLDLSSMDLGTGLSTLIDSKSDTAKKLKPLVNTKLWKPASDLAVFNSKPKKAKEMGSKLKPFISPYERYRLLVPYLEQLKVGDQPDTKQNQDAQPETKEDTRLESIKKHFQKLEDMTPKPKKVEEAVDDESDEGEVEDDGVQVMNEPVKPLQRGKKRGSPKDDENDHKKAKLLEEVNKEVEKRKLAIENKLVQEEINKKKKKRKSDQHPTEETPSKIPKEESDNEEKNEEENDKYQDSSFDYSNVDFAEMFTKPNEKKLDFNPNNARSNKKKQKKKFRK
jgi:exosome complex exonuclease RRP6